MTAHNRVRTFRGTASTHVCPCGSQAEQWSYRGGSVFEQSGMVPKNMPDGKQMFFMRWSGNPKDYDALCISCHIARDQKTHCKSNHEFTEENTRRYVSKEGHKRRACRACERNATKRYKEKKRTNA